MLSEWIRSCSISLHSNKLQHFLTKEIHCTNRFTLDTVTNLFFCINYYNGEGFQRITRNCESGVYFYKNIRRENFKITCSWRANCFFELHQYQLVLFNETPNFININIKFWIELVVKLHRSFNFAQVLCRFGLIFQFHHFGQSSQQFHRNY